MAPTQTGLRIVRSWQTNTCGTGDYFYEAEDGSVWKTSPHQGASYVTGQRQVVDGELRDRGVRR